VANDNDNLNLDVWSIDEAEYPAQSPIAEQLNFLLRYAILAPSSRNSQPWRFSVKDNAVWVFIDDAKALPMADRGGREMYISVGCALANLLIAAEHFGLGYDLGYFPQGKDSNLVALLQFGPGQNEPRFPDLFAWITQRRSNRGPYEAREVEDAKVDTMLNSFGEDVYNLAMITDAAARAEVGKLVARADRALYRDRSWRREVAAWIRPQGAPEGISAESLGFTGVRAFFAPFLMRYFDLGKGQALRDEQLVAGSPLLAILSSQQDDPQSWVGTGVLAEELLLMATALELQTAFFDQMPEHPGLRADLAAFLKMKTFPQLLLRFGYGPVQAPTPRQRVSEVLVN